MKRAWQWLRSWFHGSRDRHAASHKESMTEVRQIRRRADEIRRTLARIEAQVEAVTRDRPH